MRSNGVFKSEGKQQISGIEALNAKCIAQKIAGFRNFRNILLGKPPYKPDTMS